MTDIILRDLSIGVIAVSSAAGAAILIGASWYDIIQAKRVKEPKGSLKGRRARPLVSVIVYSQNQAQDTLACLASVLKSSHRKLEVIVVNNGSSDGTRVVLKEFVSKHSKRAVRVINKRRAVSLADAAKTGLRAAKGEAILIVDAEYRFSPKALARAADAISNSPQVAIIPACPVAGSPSVLNLWTRFRSLIGLNWQKTASLMRPSGSGLHFGVFYGMQITKKPTSDQEYRFAADIVLERHLSVSVSSSTAPAHPLAVAAKAVKKSALRPLLRLFKLVYKVLALPVFTWYALYLAMNQGYSYLLFISWAIFSFMFIFVIWTTEYLAYPAKVRLTALTPAVFSLAVIMVFVEAASSALRPLSSKLNSLFS